jgi:hypothetical protein
MGGRDHLARLAGMRLPGVLVVLTVMLAGPISHAAPAGAVGTPSPLIYVGPGATESSQRQVVRTRDDVVYIVSVEDGGWGAGDHAALHVYRATTAGVPDAFQVQDASHEPRVDAPLRMSGGDARIDAAGVIHVAYVVVDGRTLTVKYQTFDTRAETWGLAESVTTLPADGDDGMRGRIVSALALDPSGAALVVTASQSGVSAWARASGKWSRSALADDDALHPSLAFDASGRAHLAWLSAPYGASSIRYATRATDGRWSAPEVVSDDRVLSNSTLDQSPSLAFDSSARPTVAWLDRDDHVRVAHRFAAGSWPEEGPPDTFSHSPALYLRGDDRIVFLGHDANIHPAYLSAAGGLVGVGGWSSVSVFAPPTRTDSYAYDGGASPRFDPLFDPDCRIADVAFFDEDSDRAGRTGVGKPDLFYAAVTLPAPTGGCPRAPGLAGADGSEAGDDGAGASGVDPPPDPPTDPPTSAPTVLLGNEGIAPQVDYTPSGMAEAFQSTASDDGTVGSISVYVDASSTDLTATAGLYADDGGHPGVLLASGDTTVARPGQWNTIAVPTTAVKAGERYWIALLGTGDGKLVFRDAPQGSCHSETTPAELTLDALPSTWMTGNEYTDCPVSAYGTAG